MRAWIMVVGVAAGCGRLNFDATADGAGADGSDGGGEGLLVQAAAFGAPSGSYTLDSANGGLQQVTAGHMVIVACGDPASISCAISATPAVTWQQIDTGTALHVWLTCDAPPITSIQVTPGAGGSQVVLTEWSMMRTTGCFDVSRISTGCPAAPSSWSIQMLMDTLQSRELVVVLGEAGADDAGWVVDAPYTMALNGAAKGTGTNVFVAYQLADPAPRRPTATGTIAQWSSTCFKDVFTFLAQ